jgi:hypothetical protein
MEMESKSENTCDFTTRKNRLKGFSSALLFASGPALILFGLYDLLLELSKDMTVGGYTENVIFPALKALAFTLAAFSTLFLFILIVLFWSKDTLVTFGEIRKQRNGWVTVFHNGKRYKIFKMVFGRTYIVPIDEAGVTVIPTYNLIPENPHAFAHAFMRLTTTFVTKIIKLAKSHLD